MNSSSTAPKWSEAAAWMRALHRVPRGQLERQQSVAQAQEETLSLLTTVQQSRMQVWASYGTSVTHDLIQSTQWVRGIDVIREPSWWGPMAAGALGVYASQWIPVLGSLSSLRLAVPTIVWGALSLWIWRERSRSVDPEEGLFRAGLTAFASISAAGLGAVNTSDRPAWLALLLLCWTGLSVSAAVWRARTLQLRLVAAAPVALQPQMTPVPSRPTPTALDRLQQLIWPIQVGTPSPDRIGLRVVSSTGGAPRMLAAWDPDAMTVLEDTPLQRAAAKAMVGGLAGATPQAATRLRQHLRALLRLVPGPDPSWWLTQSQRHIAAKLDRVRQELDHYDSIEAAVSGLWAPLVVLERLFGGLSLFRAGSAAAPTGTLMTGPPGTGKTESARRLAQAAGVPVVMVSAPDLKSAHVGGTEERAKAFWDRVRLSAPCVVIVDECDAVFADRSRADTDAFARSMTESFLAQWQPTQSDAPKIWVIGATNNVERIDGAIMSRFGDVLEMPLPPAEVRRGLLIQTCKALGQPIDWITDERITALQSFAGRDIETLVRAGATAVAAGGAADWDATIERWRRRRGFTPTSRTVASGPTGWNRLLLDPAMKARLKTLSHAFQHAEELRAKGFRLPSALLLAGPPGTGKTEIARVLATETGLGFVTASPADVKRAHLGVSGQALRAIFERARAAAPAILFLDELDSYLPARGEGDRYTEEIVAQILVELDGIGEDPRSILLIGATNRPDRIDPAILSRFQETMTLSLPDAGARSDLLFNFLSEQAAPDESLRLAIQRVADTLDGWSGRDIRTLVVGAQQLALGRASLAGVLLDAKVTEQDLWDARATRPASQVYS